MKISPKFKNLHHDEVDVMAFVDESDKQPSK